VRTPVARRSCRMAARTTLASGDALSSMNMCTLSKLSSYAACACSAVTCVSRVKSRVQSRIEGLEMCEKTLPLLLLLLLLRWQVRRRAVKRAHAGEGLACFHVLACRGNQSITSKRQVTAGDASQVRAGGTMPAAGAGGGSSRAAASCAALAAAMSIAREHSSRHRRTSPDAEDT